MAQAHKNFGTRPWAELLGPAIEEARAGLVVDWYCQLVLASAAKDLAGYPASKKDVSGPGWVPLGVGLDRFGSKSLRPIRPSHQPGKDRTGGRRRVLCGANG
ncbi:gamma-glutamyltransferase [Leisingera thetidis]|uniref:gamma-glutamyltransferase n=1 Tax=Leisingera thetidis TaxID=2930199 RepID=UPI0021F77FCD|nr:gamma-glutamyltransferase [Leisingera thetidis]